MPTYATWGWIDTPQAYAGLPTQAQVDQISRLKGSTRTTDALLMRAAASLFKQFAKEWEAKQVLAPQPLPWEKSNPKADEDSEPEETDEEDMDPESDFYKEAIMEHSRRRVERTIHNSQQLMQQALHALSGTAETRPEHPRRRKKAWTIEDSSDDEGWEADHISHPRSRPTRMLAPLPPMSDPDAMEIGCGNCKAIPGTNVCLNCREVMEQPE